MSSCGWYTRQSDGTQGELLRYEGVTEVRIFVARTGRQIGYKSFTEAPTCNYQFGAPDS